MDKRKTNSIHVTKNKNGLWEVKRAGSSDVRYQGKTQLEARAKAIEIAKVEKLELFVHGVHGKIKEKNSYGNDPRKTKG